MSNNGFDFGFTIKVIREAKKISVRRLAVLAKISPSTVSAVENGCGLSIKNATKLANALGINLEGLSILTRELIPEKEALDKATANMQTKVLLLLEKK